MYSTLSGHANIVVYNDNKQTYFTALSRGQLGGPAPEPFWIFTWLPGGTAQCSPSHPVLILSQVLSSLAVIEGHS